MTRAVTRPRDRDVSLREEVAFWRSLFDGTHANRLFVDMFQERVANERRFQPHLEQLVEHLPINSVVRVLDVGSGPITQVGTVSDRWRVEITAVDPLAEEYRVLREEFGASRRGVIYRQCNAEELTRYFRRGSFDVVYARNALDHTCNPLAAMHQMIEVAKLTGACWLTHSTDEGKKQRYSQLHQWDFSPRQDGDLVISGTALKRPVSLRHELRDVATVQAAEKNRPGPAPCPVGWHIVVIRPRGSGSPRWRSVLVDTARRRLRPAHSASMTVPCLRDWRAAVGQSGSVMSTVTEIAGTGSYGLGLASFVRQSLQ